MSDPENEYSFTKAITDDEQGPRGNFRLLRFGIALAYAILAFQLAQIQIAQGSHYAQEANRNRYRLVQTDALRGIIYDRNSKLLVHNISSFSVSIIPADLPADQRERVFQDLSALLDVPIETVVENTNTDAVGRLPLGLSRTVNPPIRRPGLEELVEKGLRDPFSPTLIKTNVPREIAFYLIERHLDFPGVQVDTEPVREYPFGGLISHILGYTGRIPRETYEEYQSQGYSPTDQVGLTGLEATFESDLRGTKGRRHIEVDVQGREMARLGEEAPVPGHNLFLTLDLELQEAVQKILEKTMRTKRVKNQAVAIVLDPRNGDILAMVSIPSYDNNLFATGISVDDYTALAQDPLHPLVNHAITGQYPPGSTFKLIPASAALQERVVDVNTRIETPGVIWVANRFFEDRPDLAQPFYDWYKPGFGALTIRGGIAQSSDVFFYKISGGDNPPNFDNGLGDQRLAAYSRMFGLGQLSGIDLPGEAPGLVPDGTWKRKTIGDIWTVGDTYNMGIGQGYVLSTPLQVANFTAVVANGGTVYKPQLVRAIYDANGRLVQMFQPEVIRRIAVDPQNLAIVREGMRLSITGGTSINANLFDVEVAGKTGTAEYYGPKVNGHLPTHAWFTAFAPYDDPQVVVTVFFAGGGEGSEVAAPAAADILRAYFRLAADSPLASPLQPVAPPVVVRPPTPPGGGTAATPARKYVGRLLGVDGYGELPGIFGTVVDVTGRGVTGVRVVADKCDGNVVFGANTDANGAFNFSGVYWKESARWCVRTVAPSDSDPFVVEVTPYKRYTVQFVPTQ